MISFLPRELTEHIAIYLDVASLCALRLACRGFNENIFGSWAKHLHTIRTDLGLQSVQKLLAIGQNESVREHVHRLLIQNDANSVFGVGLYWSRDHHGSLLLSKANEQFKLLQTCLWKDMKNCRSFYIHGVNGQGLQQGPLLGTALTISEVVMLFLNIVAETGLGVHSFAIDLTGENLSSHNYGPASLHAPRLRGFSSLRHQPHFKQGWSHLRELHLHQNIQSDNVIWTRDLIQEATYLRKLSIRFHSSQPIMNNKILDLELPPLEALYINYVHVTAPNLLNLLHSSRQTLRRLELRSIYLDYGGTNNDGTLRDWKYFFRTLRTDFSNLHSISLFWIHAASGPAAEMSSNLLQAFLENDGRLNGDLLDEKFEMDVRQKWDMRTENGERIMQVWGVNYEGRHMDMALKRLEEVVDYGRTTSTRVSRSCNLCCFSRKKTILHESNNRRKLLFPSSKFFSP